MEEATILLVEDHPDDAFLTVHSLKKKNIENIVVIDEASKALDYLLHLDSDSTGEQRLPCLIIVDLKLPKMDGFELIGAIRTHKETCDIPVVVLSSSVFAGDQERCRELGVEAYFSKPLDAEEFSRVYSHCAGNRKAGGAYVDA